MVKHWHRVPRKVVDAPSLKHSRSEPWGSERLGVLEWQGIEPNDLHRSLPTQTMTEKDVLSEE